MSLKQEYIKEELAVEEDTIIEFRVQSKEDPNINISGCYEVTDEDPELQYLQPNTNQLCWFVPSNPFDADSQEESWEEYEHISSEFQSDDLFIQTLVDFEQENKTIDMGEYLLLINNGAELEAEIIHTPKPYNEYCCELIPQYNGEIINLTDFMEEYDVKFDVYGGYEATIHNGHIYFEIAKDYFDGEEESNLKIINEELEYVYKQYLTSNYGLGVYEIARSYYESEHDKLSESDADNFASSWEQEFEKLPIEELSHLSETDVLNKIKKEEEEDY